MNAPHDRSRSLVPLALLLALAACSAPRARDDAPRRATERGREPARGADAARESADAQAKPAPAADAPANSADANAPAVTPAWTGAREVRSHAGHWLVRWTSSLDPIVEGETFSVDAWVFDARGAEPVLAKDVALDVDAGMPQHGHGMAALARVTRRADGGWHAEGLRFHMVGAWELTFDVTRGALTERAQATVELE